MIFSGQIDSGVSGADAQVSVPACGLEPTYVLR